MYKTVAFIFTTLLFTGCSTQPKPNSGVVKVIEKCGNKTLIITDIKGRRKADGFMQAQVVGENLSSKYQRLEYRIVWTDKEGFVIESILSKWRKIPAYANQPFHISDVSPSTKAKRFRLYLKQEKEIICNKQSNGY